MAYLDTTMTRKKLVCSGMRQTVGTRLDQFQKITLVPRRVIGMGTRNLLLRPGSLWVSKKSYYNFRIHCMILLVTLIPYRPTCTLRNSCYFTLFFSSTTGR